MNLNLFIKNFWFLFLLIIVGCYDYYENNSIPSLIGAISLFIFLALLFRNKFSYTRIFGGYIILITLWATIDLFLVKSQFEINSFIGMIAFFLLGVVLLFNKFEIFVERIKGNSIYFKICVLLFVTYLFYSFLPFQELDILEIIILATAVLFGLMVILPEKKSNN